MIGPDRLWQLEPSNQLMEERTVLLISQEEGLERTGGLLSVCVGRCYRTASANGTLGIQESCLLVEQVQKNNSKLSVILTLK